ncbi:beta-ketoacyl-acyl carrier protein reductase [Candidatus Hydrogenisulfobacillus filiaventi]|uniref:3-oxoacyl-[acyl-carrier-protein] reductase n=1 Tax=Candidatus Hydrogenisulfobacillus filiaventi TaxID=2707344 RepID=A0A6F8ZHI3_9FIRM|nr:3-oxoacyl-[acyl-carrier-protein] reductase [Bacillota bacterium]CAB1129112.1 beta-ketoacyl-acyl carrier protein reductase [Candidatus Hydrogenisulfobacillus filiaventi]
MCVDWQGKVALVTGASRGIGAAIARRLAANGLTVAVNYRQDREGAEAVAGAIAADGGTAAVFAADVSVPAQAQALVGAVVERWGRLDVLVNNAGITRDTLLLRMSEEDWAQVLAADLGSVYACTKAAARVMMKQRFGRIINIASVAGITGNAGQANYAAAKAGVLGFTRAVAKELASRQITVNAVAPGLIATEMTQGMDPGHHQKLLDLIPLGREGTPDEVAHAVWYLVEAAYVTGQTLVVDGGMVMG